MTQKKVRISEVYKVNNFVLITLHMLFICY